MYRLALEFESLKVFLLAGSPTKNEISHRSHNNIIGHKLGDISQSDLDERGIESTLCNITFSNSRKGHYLEHRPLLTHDERLPLHKALAYGGQ